MSDNKNTNEPAGIDLDTDAEVIAAQVASWRREQARLQDLIDYATGTKQNAAGIDLDLDKLEALARAATPGEWKWDGRKQDEDGYVYIPECSYLVGGIALAYQHEGYQADCDFIAAANPATILTLIAQARASQPQGATGTTGAPLTDLWIHEDMDRDAMEAALNSPRKELKAAHKQAVDDLIYWKRRALTAEASTQPDRGAALADCQPSCGYIGAECDFPNCKAPSPASQPVVPEAAHAQQEAAPAGWQLVPKDPKTGTMLHMAWLSLAGDDQPRCTDMCRIYEAMLAAAPTTVSDHSEREAANAGGLTGIPELSKAFMTLECSSGEGRSIVLKFNQREDAYAVHDYLLKAGSQDYRATATSTGQEAANAKDAAPMLYTCIGKGGEYELIGTATGAGTVSKLDNMRVYRAGNRLYYRTCDDFDERMRRIDRAAGQEGAGGQS